MEELLKFKHVLKTFLDRKPVRIALLLVACLALAIFSVKCIRQTLDLTDSYVFFRAGKAAIEGDELYRIDDWRPLLNPPFFAYFMAPFAVFNLIGFSVVWQLFNVVMLVGSLLLSSYLVRGTVKSIPAAMILLTLLMISRPLESNMTLGQCNLVVVFFALAGLALFVRGSPFWGGVTLAVAISLKLTPGLFLIYFFYKKQWKMVAGIVAGSLFFSVGVPVLFLGFDGGMYEIMRWWTITRGSSLAVGSASMGFHVDGQTVRSLLFRLLSESTISTKIGKTYINIVSLDYRTVELLTYAVSGLMVGLLAWNFRGSTEKRRKIVLALELALVFMTMTMISPYSRKAHYVSLILPSMVILHYLYEREIPKQVRRLLWAVVLSTIVLIVGSSRGVSGRTVSIYLNGYGVIFIAATSMWICLNILLFRERKGDLLAGAPQEHRLLMSEPQEL